MSARDPLARRVARLSTRKHQAVQFLLARLAGSKVRALRGQPIARWRSALGAFDPKRDFALAMLHAERLTRVCVDEAIAEVLLDQCARFPDRAELRVAATVAEITTTGDRLLRSLADAQAADAAAAAK